MELLVLSVCPVNQYLIELLEDGPENSLVEFTIVSYPTAKDYIVHFGDISILFLLKYKMALFYSTVPSNLVDMINKTIRSPPLTPFPLQKLQRYYRGVRPRALHWYSDSYGWFPLESLPLHQGDRFPSSIQEPKIGSRCLSTGHRSGSKVISPELILEKPQTFQF